MTLLVYAPCRLLPDHTVARCGSSDPTSLGASDGWGALSSSTALPSAPGPSAASDPFASMPPLGAPSQGLGSGAGAGAPLGPTASSGSLLGATTFSTGLLGASSQTGGGLGGTGAGGLDLVPSRPQAGAGGGAPLSDIFSSGNTTSSVDPFGASSGMSSYGIGSTGQSGLGSSPLKAAGTNGMPGAGGAMGLVPDQAQSDDPFADWPPRNPAPASGNVQGMGMGGSSGISSGPWGGQQTGGLQPPPTGSGMGMCMRSSMGQQSSGLGVPLGTMAPPPSAPNAFGAFPPPPSKAKDPFSGAFDSPELYAAGPSRLPSEPLDLL